jgi:hypothetical protein
MITLPTNWSVSELGNTLLDNEDTIIAWLTIDRDTRLEVSYVPKNYPALTVKVVTLTDKQLVEHINSQLGGWHIRKANVHGIEVNANDPTVVDDGTEQP